jgi:acetolactate synthase-1/2/3 large subunit
MGYGVRRDLQHVRDLVRLRPGVTLRSGGELLVRQLELHGTELAFGVPGESYLPVLDAIRDSPIRYVTCRHEGGAANMAEAHGKLTGRPGICMVTRGPGATHAACGVHSAAQAATPLLLLVGQVPRAFRGRRAFQEVDYETMFGGMAKWVCEIRDPAGIPETMARAFAVATEGRPGPVVLSLPEDVLATEVDARDAAPAPRSDGHAASHDVERALGLLAAAERPLLVVGSRPWSTQAHADVAAWCSASGIPVATAWRSQDHVDNTLPTYVGGLGLGGDPRLAVRLAESDVLLVVGADLGDIDTRSYTAIEPPGSSNELIHVHPDPATLGRVYRPTLPILSSGPAFLADLRVAGRLDGSRARGWLAALRADHVAFAEHRPRGGTLDLVGVMGALCESLPADAIVTNGAGNFAIWAQRFYRFRQYATQLAPESGAMGYGLPAAIAAKLAFPERTVVCVAGDGDFLMAGQELATAVQAGAPFVVLVVDNGMYGTIRAHQERHYPGRRSGTTLRNPDFVALARAYGCYAETVWRTEEFPAAFERARDAGSPALLHLPVDPESITPDTTLTEISAAR